MQAPLLPRPRPITFKRAHDHTIHYCFINNTYVALAFEIYPVSFMSSACVPCDVFIMRQYSLSLSCLQFCTYRIYIFFTFEYKFACYCAVDDDFFMCTTKRVYPLVKIKQNIQC